MCSALIPASSSSPAFGLPPFEAAAYLYATPLTVSIQVDLFELARDAIILRDMDGRILYWNAGAEQLYGWGREEVLGRVMHVVLQTQFPVSHDEVLGTLQIEGTWEGLLGHCCKGGGRVVVESRQSLKRDDTGLATAILSISRDITVRTGSDKALIEKGTHLTEELADTILLQSLSAQMIRQENVQALYESFMDAAATVMRSDFASLQMLVSGHGEADELLLLASRGFVPQAAEFWEWVRADSQSTCGAALRTGKRIIVPDIETCDFMAGTGDLATYQVAGIHSAQSTPLFSRGNKVVGMISTHWNKPHQPSERDLRLLDIVARQAADLIERQQTEEALHESEKLFRALAETTPNFIWASDGEGVTDYVNPQWTDYTGLALEQTIAPEITSVVHPEDVQELFARWERARESGTPTSCEFRLRRASDGEYRWFIARCRPLHDGAGRIIRWFGVATDIDDVKRTEEALRYRSEQFEVLFNQTPLGVYLVDADFRIREVNPVALPVFGDVPGGVVGQDFEEIMGILWAKDYADEVVRISRHTLETGESFVAPERAEFRADRGITEYYEWRLDRITLPDGRFGLVCYFRDISQQVQARIAIADLNTRLQRAVAESHHRIKNDLQVLSGLVDVQGMKVGDVVPRTELQRLGAHIRTLAALHDLLTVDSRASDRETVSLASAMKKLLPMLITPDGRRVTSDAMQDVEIPVRQGGSFMLLVHELVSNALKHGKGDVEICLRLEEVRSPESDRRKYPRARLEVSDKGPGFPKDFDPKKSANLGLELIDSLGRWDLNGHVRFEDREEGGARVVVTFPVQNLAERS